MLFFCLESTCNGLPPPPPPPPLLTPPGGGGRFDPLPPLAASGDEEEKEEERAHFHIHLAWLPFLSFLRRHRRRRRRRGGSPSHFIPGEDYSFSPVYFLLPLPHFGTNRQTTARPIFLLLTPFPHWIWSGAGGCQKGEGGEEGTK